MPDRRFKKNNKKLKWRNKRMTSNDLKRLCYMAGLLVFNLSYIFLLHSIVLFYTFIQYKLFVRYSTEYILLTYLLRVRVNPDTNSPNPCPRHSSIICLVSVTQPTDFGTVNIWYFQLGLSRRYKIGIFKGNYSSVCVIFLRYITPAPVIFCYRE